MLFATRAVLFTSFCHSNIRSLYSLPSPSGSKQHWLCCRCNCLFTSHTNVTSGGYRNVCGQSLLRIYSLIDEIHFPMTFTVIIGQLLNDQKRLTAYRVRSSHAVSCLIMQQMPAAAHFPTVFPEIFYEWCIVAVFL
jgi:hypothetical protein